MSEGYKLRCCNCGMSMGTESIYCGIEYACAEDLSKDYIVFDQYLLGDAGLGYACSITCFHEYVDKRDQA